MDSHPTEILDRLATLREDVLVRRIILPLLNKFDFDYVEHRHGVYEKGVDVLCCRRDEIDTPELPAIQVKRLKFSGNAADRGHLHGIVNQLSQCLSEDIKLRDGTLRHADRVWFISPYPLDIAALEASFTAVGLAATNKLKIIDGHLLLGLIKRKAPELLRELGDKHSVYLQRIQAELPIVQEASVFRWRDRLSLLPVYVNLDLSISQHPY